MPNLTKDSPAKKLDSVCHSMETSDTPSISVWRCSVSTQVLWRDVLVKSNPDRLV
ncbi:MAG: hypothetical protein NWS57_07015 [Burkholderiaceae bacterium]|nr:hypothetical protein [Burkholderiaceae bacterium]